jgi:hypothetical protein
VEVNLSNESEVKLHDLALQFFPQPLADFRSHVLLVADALIDVLESDHPSAPTPLSGLEWLRAQGTLLPAWTWRCWALPMLYLGSVAEVV